jgi:CTP:molybdopterin cytidylyltransferase MocA
VTVNAGVNSTMPAVAVVPDVAVLPGVGVLLAAGAGSRFTGPTHKLLAPLGDRTVVEASLASVLAAGFSTVVVVTGAVTIPSSILDHPGVVVAHNSDWAQGQATSIAVGLRAVRDLGSRVAVIGLGDQPFVTPSAWRAVARTESPIAVATYDGERGNPVRLTDDVWSLLPTTGDVGARALMRLRPELVREVACEGSAADIDTQEDLAPWT